MRMTWPEVVIEKSHATGTAYRTLITLAVFADQSGVVTKSATEIALAARTQRQHVAFALRELESIGEIVGIGYQGHGVKSYQITLGPVPNPVHLPKAQPVPNSVHSPQI